MQRGCVSTLAASPKMARERSAESEIAANADGGCNVLDGCAKPDIDPATTAQKSNAMTGPARMSPHVFREQLFRAAKSFPEDNFSDLQKVAKELPTNHVVCSIELAHLAETISFDTSHSPINPVSATYFSFPAIVRCRSRLGKVFPAHLLSSGSAPPAA
jgi:hypothetical protein